MTCDSTLLNSSLRIAPEIFPRGRPAGINILIHAVCLCPRFRNCSDVDLASLARRNPMAQQNAHKRVRGHHFRWVVIGAVAATIVVGIAFIILLLRWPFSEVRIARSLGDTISGTVTIKTFRATCIPYPECVAENVTLRRPSDPAGGPPLALRKKGQRFFWFRG